ncbi:fatty acid desaturase family protein [Streptomyces monomycini]|uniref:fatty acid desaturase family protein n=1 Tax=Streptomyces monomycini TaxID=371720 RepID=UPI00067C1E8C|nr:fatty acid desaturase [Streptomyces monomycini]
MSETVPAQSEQRLDKEVLRQLATASRRRVMVRTLLILAAYAAGVAVSLRFGFGYGAAILSSVILGMILAGFLNAAHDCLHRSHLHSKRGNRAMGAVWATPLLVNFSVYRYQHLTHHRFTAVEGDTESHRTYTTVTAYLYALSGIPLWRHTLSGLLEPSRGKFPASVNTDERRNEARRDDLAIIGWLALVVTLTIFFPRELIFAYWLPLYFSGPAIIFLALPEHYGLFGSPEVTRNTRTVRSNPLSRFLLWNANYHAEHHRYPAVATLNLHRLHKAMPVPHPIQERSYLGFHVKLVKAIGTGDQTPLNAPAAAEEARAKLIRN